MHIRLAETAGFCMGVRRAVNMVLQLAQRSSGPIYTLGPLVHNPQVIEMLEVKGVHVVSMDDLDRLDAGTVVIRAHGVIPQVIERLRERGLDVVDATCPRVMRIQKIIGKHTAGGGSVIIVGDRGHAETTGLLGFAGRQGAVVEGPDEVDALPEMADIVVVSQTTQDHANVEATLARIRERFGDVAVRDTICDSTHRRQGEVTSLAESVDAMVVVGGKNSANTCRLAEISTAAGVPTVHVESGEEIDPSFLRGRDTIGLTAGASTPNWMITNILVHLHNLARRQRPGPLRWLLDAAEWSVRLNLLTMLGAFCLTYACFRLQRLEVHWTACLVTAFYVLSMHGLNRLTIQRRVLPGGVTRGLEPPGASKRLLTIGIAGMLGALGTSVLLGWVPLAIVAVMSAAGFVYRLPIVPARLTALPWRRLSDIPGSKDVFTAVAWGLLAVVVPRLSASPPNGAGAPVWTAATGVAFFVVAVLVFVRSVLLDILDIQTDRIVGIETLPIFIGRSRTNVILAVLLTTAGAALLTGATLGWVSRPVGYGMVLCVAWALGYLYIYRRGWMHRDLSYQTMADLTFVLAGAVAWVAG